MQELRPEDINRINREPKSIDHGLKSDEEPYGKNVSHLVLGVGYIRGILDIAAVVKYLSRRYAAIYTEFEKLAAVNDLQPLET